MRIFLFALLVLIVVFIGGFILVGTLKKTPTAKVNNHTFNLYVTKTNKDKQIGLSKYSKIDNGHGMIFSFGKADYYPFWMKQMKFPIDIIFIKDNKIVTIHNNAEPAKNNSALTIYNSTAPADTVLEVNAGLSQKYNLKVGDKITLSNI